MQGRRREHRGVTPAERAHIERMRLTGVALKQIAQTMQRPVSTVQYVLDGLRLHPAAVWTLRRMHRHAADAAAARAATMHKHVTRRDNGGSTLQRRLHARTLALTYRPQELPLLRAAEARFSASFAKEWIEGVVVKCANENMLVEWVTTGAALVRLPKKVAVLRGVSEKRPVTVFVPDDKLDTVHARRLRRLRAKVRPLSELVDSAAE